MHVGREVRSCQNHLAAPCAPATLRTCPRAGRHCSNPSSRPRAVHAHALLANPELFALARSKVADVVVHSLCDGVWCRHSGPIIPPSSHDRACQSSSADTLGSSEMVKSESPAGVPYRGQGIAEDHRGHHISASSLAGRYCVERRVEDMSCRTANPPPTPRFWASRTMERLPTFARSAPRPSS